VQGPWERRERRIGVAGVASIAASPSWPRLASIKLDRAQWACRGAPDPSAPQAASDSDPTSHADFDFGAATHPGVGGGTHRRRATFEHC